MRKPTAAVALATAVTALAAGTAGTAAAAPVPAGHLALHSWTLLNEKGPGPNPGERLTALVDARTVHGRTRGHAVVQHVFDKDGTIRVEFDIDCLTVGKDGAITVTGPTGTATATPIGDGPVTTGPAGWHPETGLTFYPAGADGERRVGWAGANLIDPTKPAQATKCTAVPASEWVIEGGTVLRRY
ncbi:hypothetical protein ABZW30_18695 [Kitasatospora sp. NPDC004669]|uniref:hypothetical protein n=1 Tax=Kitasatospora sp. NPDC004669 TaxID=3154555 RepID=UPI0033B581B6